MGLPLMRKPMGENYHRKKKIIFPGRLPPGRFWSRVLRTVAGLLPGLPGGGQSALRLTDLQTGGLLRM
jgi:hypothetical protein